MAQSWWTGWIARKIEGTWVFFLEDTYYFRGLTFSLSGDIAFEIGFVVVGLIYIPARYLERKFTGR